MAIIITGAASGIGAALVTRLKLDGFDVLGADKIIDAATAKLDVTEENDWARVVGSLPTLTGLINCAGLKTRSDISDTSLKSFQAVINVNLVGAFLGIKAVSARMRREGVKGTILNVGSIVADRTPSGQIAYNTSKGGIHSLTRSAATELGRFGIRVNAIAPGSIITPMTEAGWNNPERRSTLRDRIPLGRGGEADEVASVASFLMGRSASYVNGAIWYVDGGWESAGP